MNKIKIISLCLILNCGYNPQDVIRYVAAPSVTIECSSSDGTCRDLNTGTYPTINAYVTEDPYCSKASLEVDRKSVLSATTTLRGEDCPGEKCKYVFNEWTSTISGSKSLVLPENKYQICVFLVFGSYGPSYSYYGEIEKQLFSSETKNYDLTLNNFLRY